MISRRALLSLPAVAMFSACRRTEVASRGYAFIANQEGASIAVLDLDVMAVVKHIAIAGAPAQILATAKRPAVYALAPETGSVHAVDTSTLKAGAALKVAERADAMYLAPDESLLYVLSKEARSLAAVALDDWRVAWKMTLPEVPVDFAVAPVEGKLAAYTSLTGARLVSLQERGVGAPLAQGNFGQLRFLANEERLLMADLGKQRITLYRTQNPRLVAHLPVAMAPENLCFNADGGQLFVTSKSMDAVAIVYPYDAEVAETVVVGHAPEGMTASQGFLFITSPTVGDVTILHVGTHKVIAVVPVGGDPGAVAITPDDRFALVLNRELGEAALLDISTLQPNRTKSASVVTKIPVGSRPVGAAMHG